MQVHMTWVSSGERGCAVRRGVKAPQAAVDKVAQGITGVSEEFGFFKEGQVESRPFQEPEQRESRYMAGWAGAGLS